MRDPNIQVELDRDMMASLGYIEGVTVNNKAGLNADIDAASAPEDVWDGGGLYTGFPTTGSAETLSVFSSDVNDTAAGTGARTVLLTGLNGRYEQITETVTLNGTTPVQTVLTFWRVHTANVMSVGSGLFNAGTITVRHTTTTANVFLQMITGTNQTYNAGFTVPVNKAGVIKNMHAQIRGSTSADVSGAFWIRAFGVAARLRRPFAVTKGVSLSEDIYGGLVLAEKTDVHIRIQTASANNLDVTAGYDIVLFDT